MAKLSEDSYPCAAWLLNGEIVPEGTPGAVKCPAISKVPESRKYDPVTRTKRRLRRCTQCDAEWFTKEENATLPVKSVRIYKIAKPKTRSLFE